MLEKATLGQCKGKKAQHLAEPDTLAISQQGAGEPDKATSGSSTLPAHNNTQPSLGETGTTASVALPVSGLDREPTDQSTAPSVSVAKLQHEPVQSQFQEHQVSNTHLNDLARMDAGAKGSFPQSGISKLDGASNPSTRAIMCPAEPDTTVSEDEDSSEEEEAFQHMDGVIADVDKSLTGPPSLTTAISKIQDLDGVIAALNGLLMKSTSTSKKLDTTFNPKDDKPDINESKKHPPSSPPSSQPHSKAQ